MEQNSSNTVGISSEHLNLKVIQINLQHKRAASDSLIQELSVSKIDIALIQEPYINSKSGIIPGMPRDYLQYSFDSKSTAAIIIRKHISHFPLYNFITKQMTSLVVHSSSGSILFASVYCPQGGPAIPPEVEGYYVQKPDCLTQI